MDVRPKVIGSDTRLVEPQDRFSRRLRTSSNPAGSWISVDLELQNESHGFRAFRLTRLRTREEANIVEHPAPQLFASGALNSEIAKNKHPKRAARGEKVPRSFERHGVPIVRNPSSRECDPRQDDPEKHRRASGLQDL